MRSLIVAFVSVVLFGCGVDRMRSQTVGPSRDGGQAVMDATSSDAGAEPDAGIERDAGDSERDGGELDRDGGMAPTISGGTVTTSFDGNPPMTAMGDAPVVTAQRMGTILFFSANTSALTYGLVVRDDAGPVPFTTNLEVGLSETVGTNLCTYSGSTAANITRLDFRAQEIAGNASLLMVCMGGNCKFGCNQQFTLDVTFDLTWVPL